MFVHASPAMTIQRDQFYSTEGREYVRRLLDPTLSNQRYNCRKIYRMRQPAFLAFCNLLRTEGVARDGNNISLEEKFAMFLVTIGQNQRYGVTRERFSRSAWTVSTYFNEILNGILKLNSTLIGKPPSSTPTDIRNNTNLFPYFKVIVSLLLSYSMNHDFFTIESFFSPYRIVLEQLMVHIFQLPFMEKKQLDIEIERDFYLKMF
jgi:hypothetical protein